MDRLAEVRRADRRLTRGCPRPHQGKSTPSQASPSRRRPAATSGSSCIVRGTRRSVARWPCATSNASRVHADASEAHAPARVATVAQRGAGRRRSGGRWDRHRGTRRGHPTRRAAGSHRPRARPVRASICTRPTPRRRSRIPRSRAIMPSRPAVERRRQGRSADRRAARSATRLLDRPQGSPSVDDARAIGRISSCAEGAGRHADGSAARPRPSPSTAPPQLRDRAPRAGPRSPRRRRHASRPPDRQRAAAEPRRARGSGSSSWVAASAPRGPRHPRTGWDAHERPGGGRPAPAAVRPGCSTSTPSDGPSQKSVPSSSEARRRRRRTRPRRRRGHRSRTSRPGASSPSSPA